jgi:uncharacterized protein YdhG (YjbR/CyaY superfamily)
MQKPPPVETIDAYIRSCPASIRGALRDLRAAIRRAAPDATERISYRMPTFHQNGNLVHFAAFEHHIGFYPTPSAIVAFREQLRAYHTSKGAVQFPVGKPLPLALVQKIVKFRVAENTK